MDKALENRVVQHLKDALLLLGHWHTHTDCPLCERVQKEEIAPFRNALQGLLKEIGG